MNHSNQDGNREPLYFFDTTLRDGEQSPGCSMTREEKLSLAHGLADLGVDILEAGFAVSSEGDFNSIVAIARTAPGALGSSTPEEYGNLFRMWRERVPGADKVICSPHCHDDLGLAVAH